MNELSDIDKHNIKRLLTDNKELRRENEELQGQIVWLTEKVSNRRTDADEWTPMVEEDAKIYRGFKLDRERKHGLIVIMNLDGTVPSEPLAGRFSRYMAAQAAIDDYLKRYQAK